uniref:Uncharacterized protein n=1 Tax=Ditylenchus dipsaci TaxID=166011 RepID=A0A915ESM8_9BILA
MHPVDEVKLIDKLVTRISCLQLGLVPASAVSLQPWNERTCLRIGSNGPMQLGRATVSASAVYEAMDPKVDRTDWKAVTTELGNLLSDLTKKPQQDTN